MCTEKYINPFTDFGFKLLFGTAANKDFLIRFLNSLLGDEEKIVDVTYQNVEQLGPTPDARQAVYDIYCTTDTGSHFIVEMQNCYQRYFLDRSIYYSTFPMQEEAKKGEWNFRLPKIFTVAFLNFRLNDFADDAAYKHVAQLIDKATGKVMYDKLTYIYLEMPKFDKDLADIDLANEEDVWLYIIKNINQLDEVPEKLRQKHFERFFKKAEIKDFPHDKRQAYELSLKAMRDYNNTIATAKEQGIEQGIEIGEGQAMRKAALKMLEMGMSKEEIKQITGINHDEIK